MDYFTVKSCYIYFFLQNCIEQSTEKILLYVLKTEMNHVSAVLPVVFGHPNNLLSAKQPTHCPLECVKLLPNWLYFQQLLTFAA